MDVSFDRWVAALEAQKEGLAPNRAALVDAYIEHLRSERALDPDRFVAHMSRDVVYRRFGAGMGPRVMNYDDVYAAYSAIAAAAAWPEYEMEMERFVVTDDMIIEDGILKFVGRGHGLVAQGYTLPEGGAPDDDYLVTTRMAAFFTYRDGMMTGEDTYRDPPVLTKLG